MLNYLLRIILFSALLAVRMPAQAADFAALLIITQTGVEVQRVNTTNWIALPQDAETPFGVGDTLRTDRTGRAYLLLGDNEILVLPESTLHITAYDAETLTLAVTGRSVQAMPAAPAHYQLDLARTSITQPAALFAVQSEAADYAVVAEGTLTLDDQIEVPAQHGLRITDTDTSPLVEIQDVPINFARIEGALEGCAGRVRTAEGVELRSRGGPGTTYYFIAALNDGDPVQILGSAFAPDGIWYRIQILSDFAWVQGLAIETTCENVPQVDFQQVEAARGAVAPQERELRLLEPFYGLPADDVWFYPA